MQDLVIAKQGLGFLTNIAMASGRASAGGGTHKTLEKLEKNVEDGKYYEAQQMYKTIYARYMYSRKYDEALDLLQSGATVQLKHGQLTCGVELGVLLIEAMSTMKLSYSDKALNRIKAISKEFPRKTNLRLLKEPLSGEESVAARTRTEGVQSFLKAAIRWTSESGGPSRGAPELHDILAEFIWTQSPQPELTKASYHYVRGTRPDAFALAITESMQEFPEEIDLILARGVLLYLTLGNMRDANKLVEEAEKQKLPSEVFSSPLTHFIKFILLTLEREASPLFKMLRTNYKQTLDRDPALNELLDVIAEKYYKIQRNRNGLLGDFMKMFTEEF